MKRRAKGRLDDSATMTIRGCCRRLDLFSDMFANAAAAETGEGVSELSHSGLSALADYLDSIRNDLSALIQPGPRV